MVLETKEFAKMCVIERIAFEDKGIFLKIVKKTRDIVLKGILRLIEESERKYFYWRNKPEVLIYENYSNDTISCKWKASVITAFQVEDSNFKCTRFGVDDIKQMMNEEVDKN